jgi:hypothetical protein
MQLLKNIITNEGILISECVDNILFPGYFLGFSGGNIAAVIGQSITLAILSTIIFGLISVFSREKR